MPSTDKKRNDTFESPVDLKTRSERVSMVLFRPRTKSVLAGGLATLLTLLQPLCLCACSNSTISPYLYAIPCLCPATNLDKTISRRPFQSQLHTKTRWQLPSHLQYFSLLRACRQIYCGTALLTFKLNVYDLRLSDQFFRFLSALETKRVEPITTICICSDDVFYYDSSHAPTNLSSVAVALDSDLPPCSRAPKGVEQVIIHASRLSLGIKARAEEANSQALGRDDVTVTIEAT